jgi:hypothetical protein
MNNGNGATPVTAYPLAWPAGWPRATARKNGKFHRTERQWHQGVNGGSGWNSTRKVSVSMWDGSQRVLRELERFRVARGTIVISTNVELRRDGLPRSDRRAPTDPGVAVYWLLDGASQCIAVDIYDSVEDNLAAVAATIDAMRAIERHGGAQILKRAWQGFTALPSSTTTVRTTEQAIAHLATIVGYKLGTLVPLKDVEECLALVRLARNRTHPDKGGSTVAFQDVQECARILSDHHGVPL